MTKPALIAALLSSALTLACSGTSDPASAPHAAPGGASASATNATADKPAGKPNAAAPTAPARPAFTVTDLTIGTGREAVKGKGLSVNYTGWVYDPTKPDLKGRMFDSSADRGPFTFVLGKGQVIPGWDNGFQGMKIGGRRRLTIPPDLAYGVDGAGNGIIPPNATLIFDMELLDVQQ